ncbi:MAG: hypothetical protein WA240_04530 [Nitrospirota bacterium]
MGKNEVIMPLMKFGEIDNNGQYDVEVNLNNAGIDISQDIVTRINEGANCERAKIKFDSQTMCLTYTSETLVPPPKNIDKNKTKLLFILGNPATHSIENKMFFFSKSDRVSRHGFWGKLAKNCLLENFKLETREKEAERRRNLILSGNTNHKFVIGFTTFYSMPTPTGIKRNKYCDSIGVEKLFTPILEKIQNEEFNRICNYPFTEGAILIPTIVEAKKYLCSKINKKGVKFWPIRGKRSGWKDLSDLLKKIKV